MIDEDMLKKSAAMVRKIVILLHEEHIHPKDGMAILTATLVEVAKMIGRDVEDVVTAVTVAFNVGKN